MKRLDKVLRASKTFAHKYLVKIVFYGPYDTWTIIIIGL